MRGESDQHQLPTLIALTKNNIVPSCGRVNSRQWMPLAANANSKVLLYYEESATKELRCIKFSKAAADLRSSCEWTLMFSSHRNFIIAVTRKSVTVKSTVTRFPPLACWQPASFHTWTHSKFPSWGQCNEKNQTPTNRSSSSSKLLSSSSLSTSLMHSSAILAMSSMGTKPTQHRNKQSVSLWMSWYLQGGKKGRTSPCTFLSQLWESEYLKSWGHEQTQSACTLVQALSKHDTHCCFQDIYFHISISKLWVLCCLAPSPCSAQLVRGRWQPSGVSICSWFLPTGSFPWPLSHPAYSGGQLVLSFFGWIGFKYQINQIK